MRIRASTWAAALTVAFALGVASKEAYAADAPAAPTPTMPPDVVLLKGGGMLRGTIAELTPKKRVVIVLITGEKRTVAMTEVDYAGPASGAPGAAAPTPAAPEVAPDATPSPDASDETEEPSDAPKKRKKRKVSEIEAALTGEDEAAPGEKEKPRKPTHAAESEGQVTFDSHEPGLRVYVMTASATATVGMWNTISIDSYAPLCTTPCTTSLAPGSYRVAVGSASGKPVPVEDPIVVGSGDSVKVEYESHTGMRVAGWIILIGGTLAGTALMLTANSTEPCPPSTGTFSTCIPKTTTNSDQVLMGGVIAGASALVGLIFILQKDHAAAQVGGGPMAIRLSPTRGESASRRGIAESVAPGFGFSGTF